CKWGDLYQNSTAFFPSLFRTPLKIARPASRPNRPNVGLGRDDVVVPLARLALRVRPNVERQPEAVDLQRCDIAQAQARGGGNQHAGQPDGDAAVACARRIRLNHVLVAVPAIELRDDVCPADETGSVVELNAGVG